MGQMGLYLRKGTDGYMHYCPGCKELHRIQVGSSSGPNWSFNNNFECPDFKPSVNITHPGYDKEELAKFNITKTCHYFIDNGHINYCGDSTHELAGQSIPLPPLPAKYTDGSYSFGEPDGEDVDADKEEDI